MERSTVTVGLGLTAAIAIFLAPQLQGLAIDRPPQVAEVVVNQVAVVQPVVEVSAVAPAEVEPARPVRPVVVSQPASVVLSMQTGSSGSSERIPELDSPVVYTEPISTAPPEPIEVEVKVEVNPWDGCPACGMG